MGGLEYFHRMLAKHLDLVERRLLNEEIIPAHENVFSLFEPHTEWIRKASNARTWNWGTSCCWRPTSSQLIQDYAVLMKQAEVDQSIPITDRLLGRYGAGSVASLSFDKGFTRTGGSGVVEFVCARSGDAQTREEDRCANATGEWEEVCGITKTTQRGGEPDQQSGNITASTAVWTRGSKVICDTWATA